VLSYTRAAWVSLIVALAVYLILRLRIRFSLLVFAALVLAVAFFSFQTQIKHKLEKNRQDSSSDYTAHIKSITNISTDASNLERINRWHSAFRMFKERPFFGWGPGTYMFLYAPFQNSQDLTIISTNAGNRGNAHSEYIGPLAESGVLGTLTFILIAVFVIYRGVKLYAKLEDKDLRLLVTGVLLGLVTYLVHGILNNFLDTDKASVPFWGFIAIITVIDIKQRKSEAATTNQ
jgi:O-antigen ligase